MTHLRRYAVVSSLILLSACAATTAAIGRRVFPNGMPEVWQEESEAGRYDRFQQVHIWSLAPSSLELTSSRFINVSKLEMFVRAISKQTDSTAKPLAPSLSLGFISSSSTWRYLEGSRNVILIADGKERIDFGDAAYSGDVQSDASVSEYLTVKITRKQLTRFSTAKRVDGQVGIVEFALTKAQIDSLGAFSKRLPAD